MPTAEEVVYNHVDVRLHPLALQLDGALLAALTAFFKACTLPSLPACLRGASQIIITP